MIALTHDEGTPWFFTYKSGQSRIIDNRLIKMYYDKFVANLNKKVNELERKAGWG